VSPGPETPQENAPVSETPGAGQSSAESSLAGAPSPSPPSTATGQPPAPPSANAIEWGPPGAIRGPVFVILIGIVTLGIYWVYWWYQVFKEMKDHTNDGLGGGGALAMSIIGYLTCSVLWFVMAFMLPSEVGKMYRRLGQPEPVSAVWGLWWFLPIVGSIIWLVKTQGAMNDRWASLGVVKT
jgi:hypothetical protein